MIEAHLEQTKRQAMQGHQLLHSTGSSGLTVAPSARGDSGECSALREVTGKY